MKTKWIVLGDSVIVECETLTEAKETLTEYDDNKMEIFEVIKRYKKETVTAIVEVED